MLNCKTANRNLFYVPPPSLVEVIESCSWRHWAVLVAVMVFFVGCEYLISYRIEKLFQAYDQCQYQSTTD